MRPQNPGTLDVSAMNRMERMADRSLILLAQEMLGRSKTAYHASLVENCRDHGAAACVVLECRGIDTSDLQ